MPRLFVYGSLKRGHRYSYYLRGQTFLGEGGLSGYRLLCCGSYPAIVKSPRAGSRVSGELYHVSAAALSAIDLLEGDEYRRIGVAVEVAGRSECALVYVASDKLLRRKRYRHLSGASWPEADQPRRW